MATNYTYTTNIPVATHTPAQDQGNMQVNCTSVSQILSTDHLTFGTATGALTDGMHTVIHMQNQANNPAAVPGTGEIFTKEVTFNSVTQSALFFESDMGNVTQISGPSNFSATANGYTILPNGIIFQWGQLIHNFNSGETTDTITFPFPFQNNIFSITANPFVSFGNLPQSTASIGIRNSQFTTLTSFDFEFFTNSSSYTGFDWFAIGN
jgi:hypothetical protein